MRSDTYENTARSISTTCLADPTSSIFISKVAQPSAQPPPAAKEDPAGEVNRDKRILTGKKIFWVILGLVVIVIVWNKRHNLLYPLGAGLNGAFFGARGGALGGALSLGLCLRDQHSIGACGAKQRLRGVDTFFRISADGADPRRECAAGGSVT
jgi:hypothetical protein